LARKPYQTVSETDLARGIDARSTESRIPEGYAEDLTNVDTNSNGHLSKRPGYQGYYGYVPIRVTEISHSGTDITFTFDDSIDTSSLSGSPLVVYGLLSGAQSGDWSNSNNVEYYSTFSTDARKTYSTGSNTLSIAEADHGVDSADMLAEIVISDSASDNDNTYLVPDAVQISKTDPYDVDFDYTNSGSAGNVFVYFEDMTASSGSIYNDTTSVTGGGTTTVTITAATHGLSNFKIILEHYYDNGSEWEKVTPDSATINATSGQVAVTYTNSGSTADYKTILRTATIANTTSQTIATGATDTITVSTSDAFNFWEVLYNNSGELTALMPDSVVYDDSADTLTFTVTNSTGSDQTYHVHWDPASTASSSITVTDNSATSATYTDTDPQLTVWGISHDDIYKTSANTEGHVSHIDVYKSDVEERVVAGLGGVLHSAQTRSEAGGTYLIPTTNISIENRIGTADVVLAPLFVSSARTNPRTRGEVVDTSITSDNLATVTAVSYVSASTADYTITLDGNSGDTFATGTDDGFDYITVSSMGHSMWDGTFLISSVQSESTTEIVVRVTNSAATAAIGSTNDETGANGRAGVFTDKMTLSATTTFAASDVVTSEIFSGLTVSVTSTTGTDMYVDGITSAVSGPIGTTLTGTRTGTTFPVEAVTNFVVGDMCTLTGFDRQVRVTSIDTSNTTLTFDESLTLSDDGTSPVAVSVVGRWIPIEAPTPTDDLPDTTTFSYFDNKAYEKQDTLRSTMVQDNLYLTNYNDEVMKFDGTNLYQAGLFRWQPQLFAQLDTTTTTISTSGAVGTQNAAASNNKFQVALGDENNFAVGNTIVHSGDSAEYTVQSVANDDTNGYVYVIGSISDTATTNGTLTRTDRYRYYFRLNAIDANRNVIASAATGASDFYFDLSAAGQIHMRLLGFPAWGNYDYDALDLEVYRTAANTSAPFFRVRVVDVDFNHGGGYIDVVDSTIDDSLRDLDPVNTALLGAEIGTGWEQPLRAKYVTSADNRLVLGNLKDYPEWDISLLPDADATAVTAANAADKIWTFRKDSTNSGTTTDMTDVARYEFKNSGAVTITPTTDSANNSGASFTITTATVVAAGDWVYLYHNAGGTENHLKYAGWWQVASTNSGVDFTVDFTHDSGYSPSTADVDRFVTATTKTDIPVWIGTDGNMNQVDANTIDEFTIMQRLANAINASMRMTDTSNSSFSSFVPWLTANAGSEYGVGRLVVRQPGVFSTTAEVVLPAAITDAQIFVNSTLRAAAAEISAITKVYPSRVIVSYPNYPEIFNDPNNAESQQTIDVNSSDGQQITGLIPFFGSAAFGAGQVESTLVVFKTNSIYLLDVSTGQYNKIQSRGLGCTAPYSIAQARDGIMFANESGIFKLNRNQSISYAGKNIERIWQDTVNTDEVAKMTGHHFGIGQKYKLSVPSGSATTNSLVMVYDHQRESRDQEFGAWSKYDNHPATGWANMGQDAFMASTSGDVFSVRRAGDETDYRDDAAAITMTIVYRPLDFGAPGVRKVINSVASHFQMRKSDMDGTTLSASWDLDGSFDSAGTFTMTNSSGIKGITAQSSLAKRRGEYLQLKYVNSTKDEDVVLTGMSFEVAGISPRGIPQQSETT
jgi:hypothetical protein